SRSLLDDHGDKWAHSLALVSLRRPESSRRLAGSSSLGRRPQLGGGGLAGGGACGRRPQALARLGLGDGYRLGALGDQVDGLARREVLGNGLLAPALAQALEQRLRLHSLPVGAWAQSLQELLLGGSDAPRRDDRGEHGLAAQGQLGVVLELSYG